MARWRKLAAQAVSGCGMVLMGLLGGPAVLLLAAANAVRKASDWLSGKIGE